jgi:hypothetical protein
MKTGREGELSFDRRDMKDMKKDLRKGKFFPSCLSCQNSPAFFIYFMSSCFPVKRVLSKQDSF